MIGRFPEVATRNDYYLAVAYAVRDRVLRNSVRTSKTYFKHASRTAVYLSAEFLIGPQLGKNLVNLGIYDQAAQALAELGKDLDEVLDQEEEPGLGNGGLGRLAACYMDSMATLEIPTIGYGIRYEFGIFEQEIRDGWQVEKSDNWLRLGYPWEIARPEIAFEVKLGGRTEHFTDERGRHAVRWIPDRIVVGHALRHARAGYGVATVNTAAALEGRGEQLLQLPGVQRGGLLPGRRRQGRLGEPHQGPLPERRAGGRQAAAPRAAVLLRVVLAAGHDPHLPPAGEDARPFPRQVRRAAQRHAPVDRAWPS